jgi:diadenosine tetraphosphate (Ap4A) HIT family hydrolase
MDAQCPFCSPVPEEIVLQNPLCYARYDRYPVSKGHILIVPFRHVGDFFELTESERNAAFELVWQSRAKLDPDLHPDGYNVGVNVGQTAGQTVMHAHVHLIPRYPGDVPDPRGGVRFVIPHMAKYWSPPDAPREPAKDKHG